MISDTVLYNKSDSRTIPPTRVRIPTGGEIIFYPSKEANPYFFLAFYFSFSFPSSIISFLVARIGNSEPNNLTLFRSNVEKLGFKVVERSILFE